MEGEIQTVDNHPAEKDFDSIRGKQPAHYDHKKVSGSDYMVGGATGFNLQEGIVGESKVNVRSYERNPPAVREAPLNPQDNMMPLPSPMDSPRTEAGVDLQVPPIRKY